MGNASNFSPKGHQLRQKSKGGPKLKDFKGIDAKLKTFYKMLFGPLWLKKIGKWERLNLLPLPISWTAMDYCFFMICASLGWNSSHEDTTNCLVDVLNCLDFFILASKQTNSWSVRFQSFGLFHRTAEPLYSSINRSWYFFQMLTVFYPQSFVYRFNRWEENLTHYS